MSPSKKKPASRSKKNEAKKPVKKSAPAKAAPAQRKPARAEAKKAASASAKPARGAAVKTAPAAKARQAPAPRKSERKIPGPRPPTKASSPKKKNAKPLRSAQPGAAHLGTKWGCYQCGSKFYDLQRPEPTCPRCGANQNDAPVVETKPVAETPPPPRPPRPLAPLLDDDDEAIIDEDPGIDLGLDSIEEPDEEMIEEDVLDEEDEV